MTNPTDSDDEAGETGEGELLDEAAHDELIRKMLEEKQAKLSPEEWRSWCERMLTKLTQTVIIPRPKDDGDGERG